MLDCKPKKWFTKQHYIFFGIDKTLKKFISKIKDCPKKTNYIWRFKLGKKPFKIILMQSLYCFLFCKDKVVRQNLAFFNFPALEKPS